jgi:hypothetical protein
MSGLSILAPIASSIVSSLFDQIERTNMLSKLKYVIKKWLLPSVYCIVLDDYSYTKINLDTSNKTYIMLHPEKIFSLIMNDSDRLNLKKIKVENFDAYILLVGNKLKKILNNMRFLHKKSKFIVVVSSYNIAKKLNFSDKKIYSFMPDDELFNDMLNKAQDQRELSHVICLRTIQKNDINLQVFESWKQLNNLIADVSENNFKLNHNITVQTVVSQDDSVSEN